MSIPIKKEVPDILQVGKNELVPNEQALDAFRATSVDPAEIEKIKQEYQKVTIAALTICCTCD